MDILFSDIVFPSFSHRPFFYTSFAATIDGKIQVLKNGYWPIASMKDLAHFTHLRAQSDVILAGKNTAKMFGGVTIDRIHKEFKHLSADKKKMVEYAVLTRKADDELVHALNNIYSYKPFILTAQNPSPDENITRNFRVMEFPADETGQINPHMIAERLYNQNFQRVFLDGGPGLFMSFLKQDLIDELFLTIAPKIIGDDNNTLTLAEGFQFSPDSVKKWEIVDMKKVDDEVFIRYKRRK